MIRYLKADAWQPGAGRRGAMLARCSPLLDLSRPYVSRMLCQGGPMWALCWPMSALCWPYVGLTWPYLAPMLALCSPTCARSCPMLTLCWPKSPLCCHYVDPMFAYVGLRNALPHSSDRKGGGGNGVGTGWGGGDDGVGTARSAVGAASLYNLRLPPKASGKDTGSSFVAGARIWTTSNN